MNSGFKFHPEAENELNEIWDYISHNSPKAADQFLGKVEEQIQVLLRFPYLGHVREDLTDRPLRFVTVYSYLIAYAPGHSPLPILAVLHGSRDPAALAAILEDRKEDWH